MLLVKKLLVGDAAAEFLPFALSKLRALNARFEGAPLTKVFQNERVYIRCHVWQKDKGEVYIAAAGLAYEFFTTENIEGNPLHFDGSFTGAFINRSITSTTLSKPSGAPPDWVTTDMPQKLPTHLTVNRQRAPQYTWHATAEFMQSTLGIAQAGNSFDGRRTWRGLFTSNDVGQIIEIDAYYTYDIGFDVAPTQYNPRQTLPLAPKVKAPHWWRRACIRRQDGRAFVIATDSDSNFYAYPLKQDAEGTEEQPGAYLVPDTGYIKAAAADYLPAWAAVPDIESMRPVPSGIQYARDEFGNILLRYLTIDEDYEPPSFDYSAYPGEEAGWDRVDMLQDNHYLWTFNSTGTRAAAVILGDELPRFAEESSTNPDTGVGESRTIPYRHLRNYTAAIRVPHYTQELMAAKIADLGGLRDVTVARRAVLEVDLALTVTGPGDMDFTFEVTPRLELQDACFVDCDYAYDDSRLEALGIEKDQLLVAKMVRYMENIFDPGTWTPGTSGDYDLSVQSRTFLEVEKAEGGAVKKWQLGRYGWQELPYFAAVSPAFGDFGTTYRPYGQYALVGIDVTLFHRNVFVNEQYNRVSCIGLDLRSLSAAFEHEVYDNPPEHTEQVTTWGVNTGLALYLWGEKAVDPHPELTAHLDEAVPAGWNAMPYDYKGAHGDEPTDQHCIWLDLYRFDIDFMLGELQTPTAIASHPKGHAAFATVRASSSSNIGTIDAISRRVGQGTRLSTHLAAFNAAWATSRAYADYAPGGTFYPGRLQAYAVWRDLLPQKVTGFSYG